MQLVLWPPGVSVRYDFGDEELQPLSIQAQIEKGEIPEKNTVAAGKENWNCERVIISRSKMKEFVSGI